MAKLVDVFRADKPKPLNKGQFTLTVDENLTMVMDVSGMKLIGDAQIVKGKEFEEFAGKIALLTPQEVKTAFEVPCKDLLNVISQTVPCVGCRRSVERLLYQLVESGHLALYPLEFSSDGILSIRSERLRSPRGLSSMLHGHSTRLSNLVENQPRSKKSRRCNLHSLDTHRQPRPLASAWKDLWDCMQQQCKEEVVLIESSTLLVTLETFLRNNRFCAECRVKVLRAYSLLMEEPNPNKEKGYVPALYVGIKRCLPEKHIHLPIKTEYIGNLITRADLDLLSSGRERHAKTMAIAQEEVLCCLGLLIYERLYRIHLRMREEECACQVLAAVAIEALCRNFEMTVESKQGVSQLELLYEEITKEEQAKQQKKEHKRQKKKRKKWEKRVEVENKCECESEENCDASEEESTSTCLCSEMKPTTQSNDRHKLQVLDRKSKGSPTCYCKDCQQRKREQNIPGSGKYHDRRHGAVAQIISDERKDVVNPSNGNCSSEDSSNGANDIATTFAGKLTALTENSAQQPLSLSCKSDLAVVPVPLANSELKTDCSSNEHSQDCGYSSGTNNNGCYDTVSGSSSLLGSPMGSEHLGSDELYSNKGECSEDQRCAKCEKTSSTPYPNHLVINRRREEIPSLSLQEMLKDGYSSEEEGEESYIPDEEVKEFKARMRQVMETRIKLRQTLKERFDKLCFSAPQSLKPQPTHCAFH